MFWGKFSCRNKSLAAIVFFSRNMLQYFQQSNMQNLCFMVTHLYTIKQILQIILLILGYKCTPKVLRTTF